MTSGDEPQLSQPNRDDDANRSNAPMISGRGTKIIVSARGAYEARNLPALFDAMDDDQRVLFRQAAVREMLAHLRPDAEREAESQPEIYDTLRTLDAWLASPKMPVAEGIYTDITDTRFGDVSPIEGRLRGLVVASIFPHHNAIGYATDALLYVPDEDVPIQPHYLIMQSELEDWIFETGWAILHGRSALPLDLSAERITALIGDVDRWYRKGNLPILVQLMSEEQQGQFKQGLRHQAIWYIDQVPKNLWTVEQLQAIDLAHVWLANLSQIPRDNLREIGHSFIKQKGDAASGHALHWLYIAFDKESPQDYFELNAWHANVVRQIALYTQAMLGDSEPHNRAQKSVAVRQWQLDTAYAILTDQPIPPLGDADDIQ